MKSVEAYEQMEAGQRTKKSKRRSSLKKSKRNTTVSVKTRRSRRAAPRRLQTLSGPELQSLGFVTDGSQLYVSQVAAQEAREIKEESEAEIAEAESEAESEAVAGTGLLSSFARGAANLTATGAAAVLSGAAGLFRTGVAAAATATTAATNVVTAPVGLPPQPFPVIAEVPQPIPLIPEAPQPGPEEFIIDTEAAATWNLEGPDARRWNTILQNSGNPKFSNFSTLNVRDEYVFKSGVPAVQNRLQNLYARAQGVALPHPEAEFTQGVGPQQTNPATAQGTIQQLVQAQESSPKKNGKVDYTNYRKTASDFANEGRFGGGEQNVQAPAPLASLFGGFFSK